MQLNIPDKDQALKACSVILPPHPTDPVKIRQVATVTRSGAVCRPSSAPKECGHVFLRMRLVMKDGAADADADADGWGEG